MKAVVIGAGIGGIAIAIRLAVRGFEVEVYEAQDKPGGKLNEIHMGGYRFDAGPSLLTLPHLLDELFHLAGYHPGDHFHYQQLSTVCKYHYEDGCVINAWQDVREFAKEVDRKTTDSADDLLNFLDYSKKIYDLTATTFLFRSLHKPSTFLTKDTLKAIANIHRIDLLRSMHQGIASKFSDPHTIQLFDRYATYNGSNPYVAPATLNVIPHLEHNIGAFFPTGGMYSITTSLVKLAGHLGVTFRYNQQVDEIKHLHGRIKGVRTKGELIAADVVVSDVDVMTTYQQMLPQLKLPARYWKQTRSTSALIFYWGMDTSFPPLDLHNIFFSNDYRNEFYQLFSEKQLNEDPTVYVFISKKAVSSDAPEGKENWYVMINAPRNIGQNWQEMVPRQREIILNKLTRMLGMEIAPHIELDSFLDPPGLEAKTGSFEGALYGNSSNSRLAAFLRHPNFSRKIKGLYFTGGSVHPGGGVPLCLASAKIVDGMIAGE